MSTTIVIVSLMCMCSVFAVCFGMVVFRKKICGKIPKFPLLCKAAGGGSGPANNNSAPATGSMPQASDLAADSMKWGGTRPKPGEKVGNVVVTIFSAQSNTPGCTNTSASGRLLEAYVSIALPFSLLTERQGGPYQYGDWFEIDALKGKKLPNGKTHTGMVRLDTSCGDLGNYAYCLHDQGGKKYSGIDLFIGDFRYSGMKCDGNGTATGPAGNGQTFAAVKFWGPKPPKGAVKTYGLPSLAKDCVCNDAVSACVQTTGLSREICAADVAKGQVRRPEKVITDRCFFWMPQYDKEAEGWCHSANGATKQSKPNGGL